MHRIREPDDAPPSSESKRSSTIMCKICKQFGHHKRTCEKALVSGSQCRDDSIRVSNIYVALGLAI